jgi:hypothetical protein
MTKNELFQSRSVGSVSKGASGYLARELQQYLQRLGLVAVAVAAFLAMGTNAHAQQLLAAGSLYGGPAQVRAVCYFYNAGTLPVSLLTPQITDQNGTFVPLVINQCGASLAAGTVCGIAGNIANNSTYSCSTYVAPDATTVRGILEVRDSNQNPLLNIQLR